MVKNTDGFSAGTARGQGCFKQPAYMNNSNAANMMNKIDAHARHAFALASHAFKTCKHTDFAAAAAEQTAALFLANANEGGSDDGNRRATNWRAQS